MARTKISEFSSTPGNNTDIDSINIAENCPPSGINDAIRELMAQLKDFQAGTAGDSFNGPVGTTTAAAGAFTTLSASGAVTLSGGTANGVLYLNGSKVLTTGSALTFDGTQLTSIKGKFGGGAASNSASLMVNNATNTATGIQLFQDGIESWIMGMPANSAGLAWSASGSEQMRLTSTGLGIGTSSPAYRLDVLGSASESGRFRTSGSINAFYLADSGTTVGSLYIGTVGNDFRIVTGSNETLRLTSSGNLGLGVTPSAWGTFYKAIESTAASDFCITAYQNGIEFGRGYYKINSGFGNIYTTGQAPSKYYQALNGSHQWLIAPSGTAGAAISFTQALSLTAAGNLLLGGTTDPGGTKVLYIGNGTTPGTPTSGGVLYVESGALKYKGSSGTVTTLGAA